MGSPAYKEFYLRISSRCSNDCSKQVSNVLDISVYACSLSGCVCFLFSGICEDTCCTQEPLYSVCVEMVRLTDSGLALSAHVLSEHVQKGGVELAALGPAQERSCGHAPSSSDAGSSEHPAGKETIPPQPQAPPPTVHMPTESKRKRSKVLPAYKERLYSSLIVLQSVCQSV